MQVYILSLSHSLSLSLMQVYILSLTLSLSLMQVYILSLSLSLSLMQVLDSPLSQGGSARGDMEKHKIKEQLR
jgi:hypothetical protein